MDTIHAETRSILPSGEAENERLSLQHRILKRAYENRLFVAPVTLAPGVHVLDSGTADFLHGIDIDSRMFPLNPAPRNIRLSTDSITELPPSWSSIFTLVHQRHLILGLTLQDWQAALKETYRIINPGGRVNLLEVLMDLAQFKWTPGSIPDIPPHLPVLFEEAGFINIHVEERGVTVYGQDGNDMRGNAYRVMMGMMTHILYTGGLGFVKNAEEYEDLVNAASKEWSETPEAAFQFSIVYAQKPTLLS